MLYALTLVLCVQTSFSLSLAATDQPANPVRKPQHENDNTTNQQHAPPIVYTIAGSDSGGGAGIQADLHAIHAFGCHGCSAITCLTAQNSKGVTGVHAPPAAFLKQQLQTLGDDMPPKAIKIGMLGTRELAEVVGHFLKDLRQRSNGMIWIVLDPVMISTSGSKLLEDDAIEAMIEHIFPLADVVTPNKFEAEALLGQTLRTPTDVQEGAKKLLKMGCRSVLIKGGHTLKESSLPEQDSVLTSKQVQSTLEFAQDYLLSSEQLPDPGKERLCDASRGVWLRTPRWKSDNTHGTGCTLSSAIASALAIGEENRQSRNRVGAKSSIQIVDACCLAKAYVSAGIQQGVQLGSGAGPVAQTVFPCSHENYPCIVTDPTAPRTQSSTKLVEMKSFNKEDGSGLGQLLPIVDTVEWVEQLSKTPGITDIQLRIKDEKDPLKIVELVKVCQGFCKASGVRLWINDHWQAAIQAGCFGVHLGQEDLFQCLGAGGLEAMMKHNIALGISTHSYGELAAALGIMPSYISMGPVFATSSKKVEFDPQGLESVWKWRELIPPSVPFVTIGGINDVKAARQNCQAGANCVAVISAITGSQDPAESVAELSNAMATS
jgi:hydroxymethylpyrimidine kinase/phosphomethylpyrimidine kinase/thiamine-phosphate diphosphorylase